MKNKYKKYIKFSYYEFHGNKKFDLNHNSMFLKYFLAKCYSKLVNLILKNNNFKQ